GFIQRVSTQEQTGKLQRRRRAQESGNCREPLGLCSGVFWSNPILEVDNKRHHLYSGGGAILNIFIVKSEDTF
ncbi:MAG: hypothetical protein KAI29_03570, partial [Cyclobacteriaceae bacterium]|nr:hypothetical protein [Cyclobacteriaceae bacterium]